MKNKYLLIIVLSFLFCALFPMAVIAANYDDFYNNRKIYIPDSLCDTISSVDLKVSNHILYDRYMYDPETGKNDILVTFKYPVYDYAKFSDLSIFFNEELGIPYDNLPFFDTSTLSKLDKVNNIVGLHKIKYNTGFELVNSTSLSGFPGKDVHFVSLYYSDRYYGDYASIYNFDKFFYLPPFVLKNGDSFYFYSNSFLYKKSSGDIHFEGYKGSLMDGSQITYVEGDFTGGGSGGGKDKITYEFINPPQSDDFTHYSIVQGFKLNAPVSLKITNNSNSAIPTSSYSFKLVETDSSKTDKKIIDSNMFNLPEIPAHSTYYFDLPFNQTIKLSWYYHYKLVLENSANIDLCKTFFKVETINMSFLPSNKSDIVEHEKDNLKIDFINPKPSVDFISYENSSMSVRVKIVNSGDIEQSGSYTLNISEVDENKKHVIGRLKVSFNTLTIPAHGYLNMDVHLLRKLELKPNSRYKFSIIRQDTTLATSYIKTGIWPVTLNPDPGDSEVGDGDGNITIVPDTGNDTDYLPITGISWLDAIFSFFNKLIEGFISMVSNAINLFNSIGGFGKSFAGFLGGFFSWVPYSYVNIMTAGLTLSVLAIILKILRG